jgi:hypothetical protein
MTRRARTTLVALAMIVARCGLGAVAAAVLAGCGLGAGRGTSDVNLTVTRGFGSQRVGSVTREKIPGSETVMRMLQRDFHVRTRFGGGFVEAINGHSGDPSHVDWFYYVNGVQAPIGAASTAVHRGDRIWWDLHDWSGTNNIQAVVGSFPEPFIHGVGGKRMPVTIECAPDAEVACAKASSAIAAAGAPVARQLLGTGSGQNTIGVLVGTWRELSKGIAAHLISGGPGASGVYARFDGPGGRSLQLLDPGGRVARTLGAGAGLIAATKDRVSAPAWLVTGTDLQGVSAAAAALTTKRLHDRFAVAVQGTTDLPLPVGAR